jgi:predicted dehydrogenase
MDNKLTVGIIGVDAAKGWAREAHVPAVQALEGLELKAVSTRSKADAERASSAFGVLAYSSADELINDHDIQIVTVAAPVPAHHDLILAAVAAGKHVLTEWPIAPTTVETEAIVAAVADAGVHAAIGLQARSNPIIKRALSAVKSGAVGRVLYVDVLSTTAGFGPDVPKSGLYLEDPKAGMNLATIQAAHTIDLAILLGGELESLSVLATIQYPDLRVEGEERLLHRTNADHLLVSARLVGGGALSARVIGGRPTDATPFRLEVVGDAGSLVIEGGAPRGFQSGVFTASLNGMQMDDNLGEFPDLPDSVVNVASEYFTLRDDILADSHAAPGFDHGLALTYLVDDMRRAYETGVVVTPSRNWPR